MSTCCQLRMHLGAIAVNLIGSGCRDQRDLLLIEGLEAPMPVSNLPDMPPPPVGSYRPRAPQYNRKHKKRPSLGAARRISSPLKDAYRLLIYFISGSAVSGACLLETRPYLYLAICVFVHTGNATVDVVTQ